MIGSNLVKRLVCEGWDVYVADNLWRGKLEYLNDEAGKPVIDLDTHFFQKDLTVYKQCEEIIGFTDYIVHLADIVLASIMCLPIRGNCFEQIIRLTPICLLLSERRAGIKLRD